jgi:putative tricarboxylic transport membrane protein
MAPRQRDVVLAVAVLAIAALVLWESRRIPPPFFERIGPAALPVAIGLLLAALALGLLVWRLVATGRRDEAPAFDFRPARSLAMLALFAAYVAAMQQGLLSFRLATVAFVVGAGIAMTGLRPRPVAVLAALAVLTALGTQFVFTRVFYVDLP